MRAEGISPELADAQRRLDTLATSREGECRKRGDLCRGVEKDERAAMDLVVSIRATKAALADPQIQAAAKAASFVTIGRLAPTLDDIGMLRLLCVVLTTQVGGLVLLFARR
jgi:hypothetical protein